MAPRISVLIPNRNGASKLAQCLAAVCASTYPDFEIIVADDCSTDDSAMIASRHNARLIRLDSHLGAGAARNAAAREATGDALLFIDSDCVVLPDTLHIAARAFEADPYACIGGTYTLRPFDPGFFSAFQSVFINHFETKRPTPDYIATHCMLISRERFLATGGFSESFMPILEDVEFSHRIRRMGARLMMAPGLMVSHIFNFTLARSMRNAFRKTKYWVRYSVSAGDLASDSGTASIELKANVALWCMACLASAFAITIQSPALLIAPPIALAALINRGLISRLFITMGPLFGALATLYYLTLYPLPITLGAIAGLAARR